MRGRRQGRDGGVGAVLYDPLTGLREAFGFEVPRPLMQWLHQTTGHEQLIAQLEILPAIAAREKWPEAFASEGGRSVLAFVDNEGARFGLIKGHSPSRASASGHFSLAAIAGRISSWAISCSWPVVR